MASEVVGAVGLGGVGWRYAVPCEGPAAPPDGLVGSGSLEYRRGAPLDPPHRYSFLDPHDQLPAALPTSTSSIPTAASPPPHMREEEATVGAECTTIILSYNLTIIQSYYNIPHLREEEATVRAELARPP